MPLRDDLLEAIAGDNPSGSNLYYDKVFDQIKEARTEDDDSGSAGAWERVAKKADHALVIKLAGETLAKRSKDLRLAGWLTESHVKREGIPLLPGCLDLLWKLQAQFWETLYPEIDDDGDLGLRVSAIEGIAHRLAVTLRQAPVTKAGYSASQYTESRRVGYEEAADNSDKRAARQDAIDQGQLTAEEFDTAFAATPKTALVALDGALAEADALLRELGMFHEEKYGDDYPALTKLTTATQEVKQVVASLLHERRKTDPDPVPQAPEAPAEELPDLFAATDPEPSFPVPTEASPEPTQRTPLQSAPLTASVASAPQSEDEARHAVLAGALLLHQLSADSPVPYLLCASLRLGETRDRFASAGSDYAVAPSTEVRQTLRRLANDADWSTLFEVGLRALASPAGRVWIDVHRFLWKAAEAMGSDSLAQTITTTVQALLQDLPEWRTAVLDDDTPAANAETLAWIDSTVMPAVLAVHEAEPANAVAPVVTITAPSILPPDGDIVSDVATPTVFAQAQRMQQSGQLDSAVALLVRDAEVQPSGRLRFLRRVQIAELCLAADRDAVAYPLLLELSREIERRNLESWETGQMLSQPLHLLLQCMVRRESTGEDRDLLFDRICRFDPPTALRALQ